MRSNLPLSEGSLDSASEQRRKANIITGDVVDGDGMADIVLSNRLGGGASGEVWRGRSSEGGLSVAVKIMVDPEVGGGRKVAVLVSQLVKDFAPEARRFFCLVDRCCFMRGYECLIFPAYAMDLRRVLSSDQLFPLLAEQTLSIIWQLLSGVYYLHEIGITHADLKPENILLVDGDTVEVSRLEDDGIFEHKMVLRSCEIKIGDLDDARLPRQKPYFPAGTDGYRPPEVVAGLDWTNKVDIFAVGCVAYELFTGNLLFPEQGDGVLDSAGKSNTSREDTVKASSWDGITDHLAVSFVKAATTRNYKRRPSANALLHHKYFGGLSYIHRD
ncbi:hypothetical protein CVT26_007722 [Gymnopilus dilepis]|uniref:Protein kinase domain-containing protein n=1 Tax=Gymnopilus dilepis TaxID=231916 RepID=A0A409WWN1_9AGAR|nr:hypothetical protein CVT26_007722 [Gymnopilus dilepis]